MGRKSNTSKKDIIYMRRQRVLGLRAAGFNHEQIWNALKKDNFLNPTTGKPFSIGTINSDLKAMRQEAIDSASETAQEMVAEMLFRLEAIYRKAWTDGNTELARKCIKDMRDLFGLDQPIKQDVSVKSVIELTWDYDDNSDAEAA